MDGRDDIGGEAEIEVGENDVAVRASEHVLGLEVAVDEPDGVEVLEGEQHLRRDEPRRLEREPPAGVTVEEGVEVAAGAVVEEEAAVARWGFQLGVERREEGVIEGSEDPGLRADVGEAPAGVLGPGDRVDIDDLEGEVRGRRVIGQATVEDAGEVAGAHLAEELEVVEVE